MLPIETIKKMNANELWRAISELLLENQPANNVEYYFTILNNIILLGVNKHIPKKTIVLKRKRVTKPRVTQELDLLIKNRQTI